VSVRGVDVGEDLLERVASAVEHLAVGLHTRMLTSSGYRP
jgi:hypothetical protein